MGSRCSQNRGFTLIELIAVIVLLAVISISVSSRFTDTGSAVQASRDDVIAALFYAQQIAMARDSNTNPIRVVTSSNSISVTENGVALLHGSAQYPLTLNAGVVLAPAITLNYDKLGRTNSSVFTLSRNGVNLSVTVSDSGYAN
ncbi:MAG: pilus assembly FimT family protein [Cellvibrionaceae bacterium]